MSDDGQAGGDVTEELRVEQIVREREERTAEHEAIQPDEAEQHARRAEKAAYLKEKLDERAEAEREVERPGGGTD